MGDRPQTELDAEANAKWFATTRWSVVLSLGQGDSATREAALQQLCETYWYALYAFVRREGRSTHDAEDQVQSFLTRCIEKGYLEAADESKGRFRSFLLILFKRFLAKEYAKARTLKRGGNVPVIALDALEAERRYALEPTDPETPENLYERRWALTLLDRVLTRLEEEHNAAEKLTLFEAIKGSLTTRTGGRGEPYADIAAQLGMTEGAVKVAVHRARKRYRELLEEEIAHTVASPADIEDERRYLLEIISR